MTYPLPNPTPDAPTYVPAPQPPKRHRVRTALFISLLVLLAGGVAGAVAGAMKPHETVAAAGPVLTAPVTHPASTAAPVTTTSTTHVTPVVTVDARPTSMLDQRAIDALTPLIAIDGAIGNANTDAEFASACAQGSGIAQDLLAMYQHIDEPAARIMVRAMHADISGFAACTAGDYATAITYLTVANDLIQEATAAL